MQIFPKVYVYSLFMFIRSLFFSKNFETSTEKLLFFLSTGTLKKQFIESKIMSNFYELVKKIRFLWNSDWQPRVFHQYLNILKINGCENSWTSMKWNVLLEIDEFHKKKISRFQIQIYFASENDAQNVVNSIFDFFFKKS